MDKIMRYCWLFLSAVSRIKVRGDETHIAVYTHPTLTRDETYIAVYTHPTLTHRGLLLPPD